MILVVGDAVHDVWIETRHDDRVDPATSAPIYSVVDEHHGPGGAAMVAAMIKRLGVDVRFATVAPAHDWACQHLAGLGIHTDLVPDASRITPTKTRLVTDELAAVRIDHERAEPISATKQTQLIRRLEAYRKAAKLVVVADYGKGVVTQRVAVSLVSMFGRRVVVDPDPGTNWVQWSGAGILKCNERQASGKPARMLRQVYDLDAAVITRGERGVSWCDGMGSQQLDGHPVLERDATGCGDQFLATMAAELYRGVDLRHALEAANEAAAQQATRARIDPVGGDDAGGDQDLGTRGGPGQHVGLLHEGIARGSGHALFAPLSLGQG